MKTAEEIKELRSLDVGGLDEKLESLKEELMRLRFRHSSGQLDTTAKLSSVRKSIARTMTVICEKQSASE